MFELFGQKPMPSNVFSFVVRVVYMALMAGGWSAYVAVSWMPEIQQNPVVTAATVLALIGIPAYFLSARIEQYWLHAIWGLGLAKAWTHFVKLYPEVKEKWRETFNDPSLKDKV